MKFVGTAPGRTSRRARAAEPASDAVGRDRVAATLLTDGPATVAGLAQRLTISTTAVRRHLDTLVGQGLVDATATPPYGPSPRRGRGRPARVFALTDSGRATFPSAYDDLAVAALDYLQRTDGPQAISAFARARADQLAAVLRDRIAAGRADEPPREALDAVAQGLTDLGFAASVVPAPAGAQLCQHHCPVAEVATRFPQLCEAETQALAAVLGRHVQRLATIAHGDGVCTTAVPLPPSSDHRDVHPQQPERTPA